jgi:tagatose 1,6-diphosphate aldolase
MAVTTLTCGKLTNLLRLADAAGRFKMLAIDQRDSMRAALGAATRRAPQDVPYEEMAATKELITEVLSPYSTATLVDPVYGLPRAVKVVAGDVGLLVAVEETGHDQAGPGGQERKSRLLQGWSVAQTKRAGANAVKLLVYDTPESSADVRAHQEQIVRRVGEECLRHDLPFLLEVVTYPIEDPSPDTPEFARKRPRHTIETARKFSEESYHVDLLKLQFPGDLKYTRQFHHAVFDRKERPPVYDLDEVRGFCRELDAAAGRPWVLLSGGVNIREFLINVELAVEAGACGFLCGRAIWQEVLLLHPNRAAMRAHLEAEGAYNFARVNSTTGRARPWYAHPRFGGWDNVRLDHGDAGWYRSYDAGS